jgi:hypothetical protein
MLEPRVKPGGGEPRGGLARGDGNAPGWRLLEETARGEARIWKRPDLSGAP